MEIDAIAIETLWRENRSSLSSFFARRGFSLDDVEDLVQECFLCLWRKRQRVNFDKARSFLFGTARRLAMAHARKSIRESRLSQELVLQPASIADPPASTVASREERNRQRLRQAIAHLPRRLRQVIRMVYFENHTCRQAARRLKVPEKTIYQTLWRARQQIKRTTARPVENKRTAVEGVDAE